MISHFILYVRDQDASTSFYTKTLAVNPTLHVPGMTEFRISEKCILGLMPENGIKKLLGSTIQDPESTNGIARAELYLIVDDPNAFMQRAESAGARLLSPVEMRNWGHTAGYLADPDGHVVAFAKANE